MAHASRALGNRNTSRDIFAGLNQGGKGAFNWRDQFQQADPRQIMQGDPFQFLMNQARGGSGAVGVAQGASQPSMDYMRGILGQSSPLGQGRGNLVRQQGHGAVTQGIETGMRQMREGVNAMGRASDPEASAFSQAMLRARGGAGYGMVENQAHFHV